MSKQGRFIIGHWLVFCASLGVLFFLLASIQDNAPALAEANRLKPMELAVAGNSDESNILIQPKNHTIQFFGDIMLDRNVAKAMSKRGLAYILENVSSSIGTADITIANLEGPFALTRIKTSKSIAFRFDPKLALELKNNGFTAFGLANNHSYDMGRANVKFTRQTLDKAGLGYFGDELNEGQEYTWFATSGCRDAQLCVSTDTIAFIGLHNTYHNLNLKKVEAALKDASEKAKFVVVSVHWGDEYKRISNKKQRDLAHWLINHGADAIIGHHPHVVQEMEIYQDKPIFYSLGNFIFDQYFSVPTQEGSSVVLSFSSGTINSVELRPFYGIKSKIFEMRGERKDRFLEWFSKNSRLDGHIIIGSSISF